MAIKKKGYIPSIGYAGGNPVWYGYGGAVSYTVNKYLYFITKKISKMLEYMITNKTLVYRISKTLNYDITTMYTHIYNINMSILSYILSTNILHYNITYDYLQFLIKQDVAVFNLVTNDNTYTISNVLNMQIALTERKDTKLEHYNMKFEIARNT